MGDIKPDRSAVPDAEIVQLVLGGEIDAFDELVRRTRRPAYRLARRITRNHEDADDVVQESYVKAYRALGRFEAGRAFGPWFYTIVAMSALSHVRNRARRATVPIDEPGPDGRPSPTSSPTRPWTSRGGSASWTWSGRWATSRRSTEGFWRFAWTRTFRIRTSRACSIFRRAR